MNVHSLYGLFPGQGNDVFYISYLSFHETQNKIFKIYLEIEILLR